uniref:Uncharacterized protein n=1 Tax=Trichuris muris TaxID=70415 RepID=A0A5S6QP70_TRIMR
MAYNPMMTTHRLLDFQEIFQRIFFNRAKNLEQVGVLLCKNSYSAIGGQSAMARSLLLLVVASLCFAAATSYTIRTYSMSDVREFHYMLQCIQATCSNAIRQYVCGDQSNAYRYNLAVSSNRQQILQCLLRCDQYADQLDFDWD